MKTGSYELVTCSNPTGERRETLRVSSPFEIDSYNAARISGYAQNLREYLATHDSPEMEIDVSNANEQYKELSAWNREQHNELVEALEEPYAALAERVAARTINHQHELETVCEQVHIKEVPYAFASLPPNLFDHRGGEPFVPDTDEESIKLVSEFMLFNRQFTQHIGLGRGYGHQLMGSVQSQGFDVVLELRRRRERNDQSFATEEGRQNWRQYSRELQKDSREGPPGLPLAKNAIYTAYRNNRLFSERGGFFDIADDTFESFWLADTASASAFTSQIRVPIGWYGPQAAKELALATYLMMDLIENDTQFDQEVKKIARDPSMRQLCRQHLLRSGDHGQVDPVEYGIKQTALEGVLSVSATYGGVIEADGIPGYETDLWEGLSATLDQQTATQLTARMPAGFIAAQTLFGNRVRGIMMGNGERIRLHPEADAKLQVLRDRRTAMHHAAWSAHKEPESNSSPPVRFGLYCPFKGKVVKEMAEALMVCRAVAHGSGSHARSAILAA